MNAKEIFLKKVRFYVDKKTECWVCTNGKNNGEGYHYITYHTRNGDINHMGEKKEGSKRIGAHRLSYMAFNRDIKKGLCVIHTCDNPSCVNPNHLIVGTRKQNTQDMINKKRDNAFENGRREKLTEQQILDIYHSDLSSYELSKIYPVSSTHIRRIKNGMRCSDVTGYNGPNKNKYQ